MGASTSFLQVATVGNALLWPLAAGAAVVVWSKVRAAAHARRTAEAENRMRNAYRALEARPVPPRLARVVDALDEGEAPAAQSRPERETSAGS